MRAATLCLSVALFACVLALAVAAQVPLPEPVPTKAVDPPKACPCPCGPGCDCDGCACPRGEFGWWPGKFLLRPWRHPSTWRFPRRPRRCY